MSEFEAQIVELTKKINNIKAQQSQAMADINSIKTHRIDTLMREAVALSNETKKYNEAEQLVTEVVAYEAKQRFFGEYGEGNTTDLKSLHDINSKGDISEYSRSKLMVLLCFAILGGLE